MKADVVVTGNGHVVITRNRIPCFGATTDGSWFAQGGSGHSMVLTGYREKLLAEADWEIPDRLNLSSD